MTKVKMGNDVTGAKTGGPNINTTEKQYQEAENEYEKNKKAGKYKNVPTADSMVVKTKSKVPVYEPKQHEYAKRMGVKLPMSTKNLPVSSKNVAVAEAKLKPGLKRQF